MDAGGVRRREARPPEPQTSRTSGPDWSPDGSRIVVRRGDGAGGLRPVRDERGRHRRRRSSPTSPATSTIPRGRPTGARIAFAFDDLGVLSFRTGIVIVDPDGRGRAELVTRAERAVVESPRVVPGRDADRVHASSRDGDGRRLRHGLRTVGTSSRCTRMPGTRSSLDARREADRASPASGSISQCRAGRHGRAGAFSAYPPESGRLVLDWSPDGRWIVMSDARRRIGDQVYLDARGRRVRCSRWAEARSPHGARRLPMRR